MNLFGDFKPYYDGIYYWIFPNYKILMSNKSYILFEKALKEEFERNKTKS